MYSINSLGGNSTTYIKEKKFHDKTWLGDADGRIIGESYAEQTGGYSFTSKWWENYDFNNNLDIVNVQRSNILNGIKNGPGVKNRTGNKIDVEWIKGSFTITTCALNTAEAWGTNLSEAYVVPYAPGEGTPHLHYMRSSIRLVIVKDLQYMSENSYVEWEDVFESDGEQYLGCIHTEQKISNMQRYKILSDQTVVLNGFNPITTIPFYIKGSDIGQVFYNGDDEEANTSSGVHVVWAAYVPNYWNREAGIPGDALIKPTIVGHTRVCFTDA